MMEDGGDRTCGCTPGYFLNVKGNYDRIELGYQRKLLGMFSFIVTKKDTF